METSSTQRLQDSIMKELTFDEPTKPRRKAPTWMWVALVTVTSLLVAVTVALAVVCMQYYGNMDLPMPGQ